MTTPKLQKVGVHLIVVDAGTQSRASINEATVEEYADGWLSDAEFPPLDVFQDTEGKFYLADGFHRLMAAKLVRKATIPCRVFSGTSRHAFLHACGANATHGLRRTNADKRHMVSILLSDPVWAAWTDSRIADVCGVSHPFVATLRREHQKVPNSAAASVMNHTRCGADGKAYPASRKRQIVEAPIIATPLVTEGGAEREATQEKALAAIKDLSCLLRVLGIYNDHAKALTDLARAVKRGPFFSNRVLPIASNSMSALVADSTIAS